MRDDNRFALDEWLLFFLAALFLALTFNGYV